ncbi:VRR-NUC domain protein (plasmid) [Vibrio sp. THAF191c]|nr:VRR-NUC domain protein [Vibrio sp. THAF64]QGM37988.1 VRR-NUC domain protein [Vibrio sp. THAF191d]QGN73432.1 VRR-NUC domain protein [Vibrio sp. THAF191c]
MAKGPRFDLAFLGNQMEKRKNWKKRGVKAGHGGDFNICDPLAEINRSVSREIQPPAPATINVALVDTNEIPAWAIRILERDSEVARSATSKKRVELVSPHKTRIAQGIKKPSELNDTKLAEHWLQVRIFYTLEVDYPDEYEFAFAVPNGGHRSKRSASLISYEGQKKGTPDVFIPIPKGIYHGMFLEVKTEKGTASKDQKSKAELYRQMGYYVVIAKGYDACMAQLTQYFALPSFDNKTTLAA